MSQRIFEELKKPIQRAVQDSGLAISDIDKCILVGGSCNMPIVQDFLNALMRVPVVYSHDTDLAVAKGLGTYVGIKQRIGQVKDLVLTDICPFSLNINVYNRTDVTKDLITTLIPRNTALPASRSNTFWTVDKGQAEIKFTVNQGEEIYAEDNTKLGELIVAVPSNKKEYEAVDVTFIYDINAMLVMQAKVVSTKKEYQLVMAGKGIHIPQNQLEKYIKSIQNLKLVHYQRMDLLLERAKRIYAEVSEDLKPPMQEIVQALQALNSAGSIRKTNERLDEIESTLKDIEKSLTGSDIFNKMPVFLRLIKNQSSDE